MKNIFLSFAFLFIFSTAVYSQIAPIAPMNIPEVFDNSIPFPQSAVEGFNMFTDSALTELKPEYEDKIKLIKDYQEKVNDFILETSNEVQRLAINNDPLIKDTAMKELDRRIRAVNMEMSDIFMLELNEVGTSQAEFSEDLNTVTDNKEKIDKVNAYISGKYAELWNKYFQMYREKLLTIYALYQEADFGNAPVNPITKITITSSLLATLEAYVNHKNEIAKGTAERAARYYISYKN